MVETVTNRKQTNEHKHPNIHVHELAPRQYTKSRGPKANAQLWKLCANSLVLIWNEITFYECCIICFCVSQCLCVRHTRTQTLTLANNSQQSIYICIADLHFIAHGIYMYICCKIPRYTLLNAHICTKCVPFGPYFHPFTVYLNCVCLCAFRAYIKSELLQAMHSNATLSFQLLAQTHSHTHIIYIMFCLAETCRKFNQNLLNLLFYIFPPFSPFLFSHAKSDVYHAQLCLCVATYTWQNFHIPYHS